MRANRRTLLAALSLLASLALALTPVPGARAAEPLRADPLLVPTGPLPQPEQAAGSPARERVLAAAKLLRARGYDELPVLAWALLDAARANGQSELAARAAELAPGSPGVQLEAALVSRNPLHLYGALRGLFDSLPGALWLLALAGLALGGGTLALALGVSVVSTLRGLPLHGHALGHGLARTEPPAWPGVLLCLAFLAALPLFGVGWFALVGFAGALGALRQPRAGVVCLAFALLGAGLALGPGLDRLAPAVTAIGRESVLLGAWRVDHGESLPGDLERVERAAAVAPTDSYLRLVLATDWKRRGELERARQVLGDAPDDAEPALRSAIFNLHGIMRLAEGSLVEAIPAFERARSAEESAPVLFNLSQAYGRALRLSDQQPTFAAARALDASLVDRYMAADGASVHDVLIHAPLRTSVYLARVLRPSGESETLAAELRERVLGPARAQQLWLALPVAGLLAYLLRRKSVARCSRCQQPLCAKCSREAMAAGTCMRCVRLFLKRERTDPRIRQRELDRDRGRKRRAAFALACAALAAPGTPDLVQGRFARGAGALFAFGLGVALLHAPALLPQPFELGALGHWLPLVLGGLTLAPLYVAALKRARHELRSLRSAE